MCVWQRERDRDTAFACAFVELCLPPQHCALVSCVALCVRGPLLVSLLSLARSFVARRARLSSSLSPSLPLPVTRGGLLPFALFFLAFSRARPSFSRAPFVFRRVLLPRWLARAHATRFRHSRPRAGASVSVLLSVSFGAAWLLPVSRALPCLPCAPSPRR